MSCISRTACKLPNTFACNDWRCPKSMATSLNFLIIFMTLAVTTVTVSCSGAKFAASSGKSSGGTTEKPAEQPEDVAGGFGLTCTQADNQADPLSIDYSCTFVTNIGQKFQETADQKVELKVQSGGKDVTFVNQDPTSSSSFKFTVLKSEITSVKIAAKVTNPLEGNKIKGEINKALSDVIDTTPPFAPSVTGTSTPTANTTPTWSWSSGGNGGNGTYRYRLNNSNLASGAVEISGTSFTPGAALSEGTHTLYVQERDAAGNWSASGSFAIQVVTPPAAPILTPPTRSLNSLSLSWASVTGATSYNLYWANSAGVTTASSKIANVVSVYNHTSLSGGRNYYYKLAAVKSGVESALSNEVSAAPYSNVAPTVTDISPSAGPTSGGTPVTITGTGFVSGATVTIGSNAASVTFGSSTSLTVTTPPGTAGAKNVLVTNPDTQTASSSFTYGGFQCSGINDDCYAKAELESVALGTVIPGPDSKELIYQFANGSNGFKIWKENGGSRFLNASGKIRMSWQMKLEANGKTFSSNPIDLYLTDFSKIAGRVCPPYVYSGGTAKLNSCLFYTSETNPANFQTIPNNNEPSTDNGGLESWLEANIPLCANKGMRLPTAYEVRANQVDNGNNWPEEGVDYEPDGIPADQVPLYSDKGIWTATGSKRAADHYFALVPNSAQAGSPSTGGYRQCLGLDTMCLIDYPKSATTIGPSNPILIGVRCVIPGT